MIGKQLNEKDGIEDEEDDEDEDDDEDDEEDDEGSVRGAECWGDDRFKGVKAGCIEDTRGPRDRWGHLRSLVADVDWVTCVDDASVRVGFEQPSSIGSISGNGKESGDVVDDDEWNVSLLTSGR